MESPPQCSRPVARGEEPTQEQVICQELLPVEDPCWSSLLLMDGPCGMDPYLELLPVGSPHRTSSERMASCARDPTLEQGESDHEGAVGTKC